MTYFPIQPRYYAYIDTLGDPLDNGYIYFGQAGLDPVTYPAKAAWDESGLYPVTFPVRTMNGYPLRDGFPAQMYLHFEDNEEYSVLINDEDGDEVFSSSTEGLSGYFPSDTGGDSDTLNGLASDTAATADTIAARDSSGDITANAFESTVATGTAPLTVASTTVVSNLNADLLDGQEGSYYAVAPEEGTFTPVLEGVTTAGTGTYTAQVGRYQKIGTWVHYRIAIGWSAHTGTGAMKITGLPYTTKNDQAVVASISLSSITYTAGATPYAVTTTNTDEVRLYEMSPSSSVSAITMDTSGTVNIQGSYQMA